MLSASSREQCVSFLRGKLQTDVGQREDPALTVERAAVVQRFDSSGSLYIRFSSVARRFPIGAPRFHYSCWTSNGYLIVSHRHNHRTNLQLCSDIPLPCPCHEAARLPQLSLQPPNDRIIFVVSDFVFLVLQAAFGNIACLFEAVKDAKGGQHLGCRGYSATCELGNLSAL